MSRIKEGMKLLASIAAPQTAGGIGSISARAGLGTWYARLEKPSFTPPSGIFAPVWITLYILMGLSVFLVWHRGWKRPGVKPALSVFGAQLVLNALWSYAFFGRRSPGAGLAVIVALWALILVTTIQFFRISRTAAVLIVPYFLWVSFAAVLNYSIYVMNKEK